MQSIEPRIKTKARVRVTLDIDVDDVWGADCPMRQVYSQAIESARNRIASAFNPDRPRDVGGHPDLDFIPGVTVIGEMEPIAVIVPTKT